MTEFNEEKLFVCPHCPKTFRETIEEDMLAKDKHFNLGSAAQFKEGDSVKLAGVDHWLLIMYAAKCQGQEFRLLGPTGETFNLCVQNVKEQLTPRIENIPRKCWARYACMLQEFKENVKVLTQIQEKK